MSTFDFIRIAWTRVHWTEWFRGYWWEYLLEKSKDPSYTSPWHRFWCRAAGHPAGVWWQSHGPEPDMRCKECHDDLG